MRPRVSHGATRDGVLAHAWTLGLSLLGVACHAGPSERSEPEVVVQEEPDAGVQEPLSAMLDAGADEAEPEPPESDPIVESAVMKFTIAQLEIGRVLAELDAIREGLDDSPERPWTEREREVDFRLRVLRGEVKLYSHGAIAPGSLLGPHRFAEMVEERARRAEGKFQRLIHPQLGLFVVHNVAGSVPHLDRVTRWPRGDYDYSTRLDDVAVLNKLARASQFKRGGKPPVSEDDEGCTRRGDTVQLPFNTVFDAWASIFGSEWDGVPDRHLIEPWAAFSARNREVEDDLNAREFALMQRAALAVSIYVIVDGVRLDFGPIDDEWYVLAIDILDDACG